jgi:uncharacterized repeat protein (TIGR01451 family)
VKSGAHGRLRALFLLSASVSLVLSLWAPAAYASPTLTIRPITWNVVGLDSNNVSVGPDKFASGARVCNTGSSAATNVVSNYEWLSSNSYISLQPGSPSSISIASLAASTCFDFYYNLQVTRDAAAYDTARRYEITATADGLGTISTPSPREIYVEHLISQNRNYVTAITGPGGIGDPAATTVYVGQTYTYKLFSSTATQGYEQLSTFLNFPNVIFQILSVNATYTAPAGGTNDTIYADACGWDNDPTSPTYRSCVGPTNYSGGKAGGDVVTTYVVKILAAGTSTISGLVYDHSGSSYHYNSDLGTGVNAVTITAVPDTDLSLTKSDAPDPVTAGQNITYTMVATNNGPSDATGVTISDPIPGGTSFVSADSGGSLSSGTVTWSVGALASGASATVHLVVKVDPSRTSDITNTATISGNEHDPDSSNDSATATTSVVQSADLSITKSDAPDPVTAGQNITYTIGVANNGPSDATGVTVSDPVPAGTSFVSADSGGSLSAGTVTWSLGALAATASTTVHLVVKVDPNQIADVSNTANVTGDQSDPDNSNNSATATTSVTPAPPPPSTDLSITKSDSPDPVTAGQNITYTIGVTNNGPDDATGVTVSDPVPAGTSFVSADSGGSLSAGTVTWAIGALASGGSTTVHLVVQVDAGRSADISNTATVSGNEIDPDGSNDSATATTSVVRSADLLITKSDAPDPVTAGQNITYTIGVTNNGPSDATGVAVSDPIPGGTSFVSADSGGSLSAGVVTWSVGTLASAASTTVHLVVQVDPSRSADVSNTATVSGDQSDPDPTNDSATATTSVTPAGPPPASADLSVTKSALPDPVTAGDDLTYTIGVTNNGPDDATGVTLSDPIPAGTSFVSADSGGSLSGGTVSWSIGALASGGSTTVHLVVQVDPSRSADVSNTATVSGDQSDPDPTNDSATVTTNVTPAPASADLWVTKSASPDPVRAGADLTYTLVASNNGPDDATGVTLSDPIPAGTSFVSADSGGSLSGGTVTWSIGALASGANATVHLVVNVDASRYTDVSNTATVSGDQSDPDATNNSDSVTTNVIGFANLVLVKTVSRPDPKEGSDVCYKIILTNKGPARATGVLVRDLLPSGLRYVSSHTEHGAYDPKTGIWNVGDLNDQAEATLRISAKIVGGVGTRIVNHADVRRLDQRDRSHGDNASSAVVVVAAPDRGPGGQDPANGGGSSRTGSLALTGADVIGAVLSLTLLLLLAATFLWLGRRATRPA